jgi:hypothetical protein
VELTLVFEVDLDLWPSCLSVSGETAR